MSGLLPKVNEGTGKSVQRDYARDTLYSTKLVERLSTENPCILNFINEMSNHSKDPESVLETSLLVYRLLESQAEADKLDREYGEKENENRTV